MHRESSPKFIQWADHECSHSNWQRLKLEDLPGARGSLQDNGILLQLDVQPEVHKLQRKVQVMKFDKLICLNVPFLWVLEIISIYYKKKIKIIYLWSQNIMIRYWH